MNDRENFVFDHWQTLTSSLGVTETVRANWWSIIVRRYSEVWRFYHTLWHIEHLLQLYDQWKERIEELHNVALSIFFHDIVYDPDAKDNELRSVVVFKKFARDAHLSRETVDQVSKMIEATISHSVDDVQDDLDLSLFLDFDLAILGQNVEVYKKYAEQIRKEYIHLDDLSYKNGRTKVLQTLLNSPSLFASEELRQEYEEQARKNLMDEIAILQGKT